MDEKKHVVNLFPKIKKNKSIELMTYLPGNEISAVKDRQKLNFAIAGSEGKNINLTGQVKKVNVYPTTIRGQNMYQVLANVKVKAPSNIRYGMQGNTTIITGEMTYFEYFKDKILNQK